MKHESLFDVLAETTPPAYQTNAAGISAVKRGEEAKQQFKEHGIECARLWIIILILSECAKVKIELWREADCYINVDLVMFTFHFQLIYSES